MDLLVIDGAGIRAQHVRFYHRLVAESRKDGLDDELAHGVQPEANVPLALRAQRLVRPSERRSLARSLKRVVQASELSPHVPVRAPVQREAVRLARAELESLADRLLRPGPVGVQGVAQARLLLRDGAGPLYRSGTGRELRSELGSAISAMGTFT